MEMRKISRIHYSTVMWFLNLSEPPHDTTVSGIQRDIVDAYNNVASQSMVAANETKGTRNENKIYDITVSCDGTWQKRGYNSPECNSNNLS